MSYIASLGRWLRGGQSNYQAVHWLWQERAANYALWDAYFHNTAYERTANGGYRDAINTELGNAAAADLAGLYNPVAQVVGLYASVFAGAFGDEIRIEPTGAGGQQLIEAINQVWQWSNLTVQKQQLCRIAATHGLCGLRIVARDHEDPARKRVYIKPEHPRIIRDMRLDDRGNVIAIQLEYDLLIGLAEKAETLTIREQLEPERIQTWRMQSNTPVPFDLSAFRAAGEPVDQVGAFDNGPGADVPNALGVVPYVALYHELSESEWGLNCFYKARAPIDRLNALECHTDIQVHQHVRATWLLAAAGAAPARFVFDDKTIIYVDTRQATSNPMAQAMVANLDLQGALAFARQQLDQIEDMLPELKATAGHFLSGQSGETVAELRKPAAEKVGLARTNYEEGLVKAQKIAASWMVLLGIADLGTGTGTREAADQAYREGFEDHRFNRRPLLQLGDTGEQPTQQTPAQPQQERTGETEPSVEVVTTNGNRTGEAVPA